MNERIKELVEQAITQNESGWPDFRKALTGSGSLYLHVFAEEFAELIVQECADFIDSKLERGDEIYSCADGEDLKQHFGVEE